MSWLTALIRGSRKVKFGKPLSEIGANMLLGLTLNDAVVKYGKDTVVKNVGREKIALAFDEAIALVTEDNRIKAIQKLIELKAEVLG
jgi:energy-converting hydrogenase Eha subunit E